MPRSAEGVPAEFVKAERKLARDIAARVKTRRMDAGLSQRELRDRMQLHGVYVTKSQYSRFENGERLPVASEVIALASALDVTCAWILGCKA